MDNKRRDFLKNLGRKTATAAAAVTAPTMAYADQFAEDLKHLSGEFQYKLAQTSQTLGNKISHVSARVDAASVTMAWQQAQLHLIFLLLLISFAIDGGMTLAWLF